MRVWKIIAQTKINGWVLAVKIIKEVRERRVVKNKISEIV